MKCQFDGTREMENAPRNFDGEHEYDQVKDLPVAHGKKGKTTLGKRKAKKMNYLSRSKGGKRSQFYGSYLTGHSYVSATVSMPCM